jgi:carbonic anhydrase/acetyltransferase-like protein (isoleucine patch superfamily)
MRPRRSLVERRWLWQLVRRTLRDVRPPHPSHFAAFGAGSVIVPPARVPEPHRTWIGDGTTIHENAWLSVHTARPDQPPALRIGDRCSIGRSITIACIGSVTVGDDVLIAERVFIGDTYHDYRDPNVPVISQPAADPAPVIISDGAFLGVGAIVLRGVTVGRNAYVAAGAVVTEDVPDRTVVAGNPARPVRRWDEASSTWISC